MSEIQSPLASPSEALAGFRIMSCRNLHTPSTGQGGQRSPLATAVSAISFRMLESRKISAGRAIRSVQ
jgi:hypothetical protein